MGSIPLLTRGIYQAGCFFEFLGVFFCVMGRGGGRDRASLFLDQALMHRYSLDSDEHCVTAYDVVDWLYRGGFEFGEWLRLRLIE